MRIAKIKNTTKIANGISTKTKIIDSAADGATVKLKSIEKGRTVSVTGSNASGVLEASVIVLQ